jgi:hypothetical protein
MKPEKKTLFLFLGAFVLCILCSSIAYYWDTPRNLFQKKTVPSPLLAFGETGKILRKLGSISPLENKQVSSRLTTNPVEFLRRASREKEKWLLLERFKKYKKSGIFGYMEMQSQEPAVRFKIEVFKNGSWSEQVSSQITSKKIGYSFFIDADSIDPELRFTFHNKEHPVHIYGIGFLKNGHHPLVFNDQIGYSSFFRNSESNNVTYLKSGAAIGPLQQTLQLSSNLSFQEKTSVGISKYYKKQGSTPIDVVASSDHPLLNRLRMTDEDLAAISFAEIPVLAIDIDSDDLYSENYGILTNYDGHGREWERLGYARFFKDGQSVFSTFSGIRLQGGDPGREKGLINFRLYFREEYGTSHLASDRIFNGSVKIIKRLAVKQSQWKQWPLNGPISYDVARKAGGLVPPTEICLLYLNGENLGLYYMVPHLGEKQIKIMLPEEDYQYFRIRGTNHDADWHFFSGFIETIKNSEIIDESYASRFFDLENLVQLIFSYIINATGDFCQGILLKGSSSDSRYFWYGWDFDHSYVDVPVEITKTENKSGERWEQPPSFAGFLKDDQARKPHHCLRVNLFKRLLNEDPEFREKTKHLFTSTLNHRVTREFIAQLLGYYQQILTAIDYPGGDEYIDTLRTFFAERIPFLLNEMEQHYPTDSVVVCEVTSDTYPITVDGYKKEGPYSGYYFPGSILTVSPGDPDEVRYWLVNGTHTLKQHLALSISRGQGCLVHGVN